MAVLSTTPDVVDLQCYAGDTLTIRVEILDDPAGFIAGREWSAQVRSAWDAATVDAQFVCTPDATGCTLTLPAAQTSALVGMTLLAAPGTFTIVQGKYVGVWDVQLAPAGGGDPTTTVARGQATFTGDVTRQVAP
jgi:hypothetical protein